MKSIEHLFLFEDHKTQFCNMYNNATCAAKEVVLKEWRSNYLFHLYQAESDKIMLKFDKDKQAEDEAFKVYGKRVPSLSMIHDAIHYWENIEIN